MWSVQTNSGISNRALASSPAESITCRPQMRKLRLQDIKAFPQRHLPSKL